MDGIKTIRIGGREYQVRFSFGQVAELERITGKSLAQIGASLGVDSLTKAIWVLVKRTNPRITEKHIHRCFDKEPGLLKKCADAFNQAILDRMSAELEGDDDDDPLSDAFESSAQDGMNT